MINDDHPKTSALIPAYNAEETLERAVQSIRSQTVPVDEIIIGADGCTDRTVELGRDLGCVVLDLPKKNGAAARNAAFEVSQGEILFLLDADDQWLPRKVESHLRTHAERGSSFVLDASRRVRPDGSVRGINGGGEEKFLSWKEMVEHRNWSSGSAISVRRRFWEKVGGFNPELMALQDVDFLVRIAYYAGPGFRVSDCHTLYHLSSSGISRNTEWGNAILEAFCKSCDFLGEAEIASVRRTVALRNALLAGPAHFWQHVRWGKVPINDPRVWKLYALVLARSVGLSN